eukprot:7256757-Prymnesium_polylepis.1
MRRPPPWPPWASGAHLAAQATGVKRGPREHQGTGGGRRKQHQAVIPGLTEAGTSVCASPAPSAASSGS